MLTPWLLGALMSTPTPTPAAGHDGIISGVVTHRRTKERIPNALVILQCACLSGARETQTNVNGLYAFRNLPPGTYTVQVLTGQADVSKVVTLPAREPSPQR
jgi:hypothetical protein